MKLWPTDRRLAKSPKALKSLLVVSGLFLCLMQAPFANELAAAAFARGQAAFERKDYEPALASFEEALAQDGADARYPLWAGRSAGRLAEGAGPFRAFGLARSACRYFERAYQLDPRNPEVVADLAEFHEKAPGFVGGDSARARELRSELKALAQNATGTPP